MAEGPLRQKSSGPPTDQCGKEERCFRNPPLSRLGATLVASVDKEREDRQGEWRTDQDPPIDMGSKSAQGVRRDREQ